MIPVLSGYAIPQDGVILEYEACRLLPNYSFLGSTKRATSRVYSIQKGGKDSANNNTGNLV